MIYAHLCVYFDKYLREREEEKLDVSYYFVRSHPDIDFGSLNFYDIT